MITLLSCEDLVEQTYKFNIRNESDFELYFTMDYKYPDTTLSAENTTNRILPMSTFRLGGFRTQDKIFDESVNDTLSFFFLTKETIENNEWYEIRSNYLILKRFDVSYDDFQSIDFEIVYPPTIEMENIRMYPTE
ncbi:hypothetical protein [Winogradskyella forsetii]|uniref:hypothetical protein n=1 Tax=Winogradskyella forsetii TaxID=2686077 RepID=UPI0015BE8A1D|nr:hypothetical protein [Winogradskyella forsetii]